MIVVYKKWGDDMADRPLLSKELKSEVFRDHYYLKEELVDFCRQNGIPTTGGKIELTERIACFLDTGKIPEVTTKKKSSKPVTDAVLTQDSIIEPDFVCSEKHRAFFREHIGKSFSFNVQFQKWLKSNTGKTYREAIEAYHQLLQEKKQGKTTIDKQFEYNTYIRDFFADNAGRTLEEAIKCWKYKKSLKGHNRYERSDLSALTE